MFKIIGLSTQQGSEPTENCPECGGDGADHEDSSRDCFECHGSGYVPGKPVA